MFDSWQWLNGTFWIVPESNLIAATFSADQETPNWLSDQTVWQITGYRSGYFWGNAAVQMQPAAGSGGDSAPVAQRLTGSITPEANVHMTFIPLAAGGDPGGTLGIGNLRWRDGAWMAGMQMSAPFRADRVVLHWAYMVQCRPGDAGWERLPGTDQSLPQFMSAAGFAIGGTER